MLRELDKVLENNGFEFVSRTRGKRDLCWVIGTRRANADYGDKSLRLFLAIAESAGKLLESRFKFSVSGPALASEWVKNLIGNAEEFLLQAGLTRFRRLLQENDGSTEEFDEVLLTSRSQPEEFYIDEPGGFELEIERVRSAILSMLRQSAYKGRGHVKKEQLIEVICADIPMVDQTLRYLQGRKLIDGANRGEVKITPEGEAELTRLQGGADIQGGAAATPRPTVRLSRSVQFDVFISHASEDKDEFVRPLASSLKRAGLNVWYDEFTLKLGDSLRKSIDHGLAASTFGIVVLSHAFFSKRWPQQELNGLYALMESDKKKILPIWHNITADELKSYSPMIADLLAARSDEGIGAVVSKIMEVVKPVA